MKPKRIICHILCCLIINTVAKAQDDPIGPLLKKLDQYTTTVSLEKVHLHLDKPYYSIGEDIWLRPTWWMAKPPEPTPSLITPTIFGYHVPRTLYVPKYERG